MKRRHPKVWFSIAPLCIVMAACGGGGGGDAPAATPTASKLSACFDWKAGTAYTLSGSFTQYQLVVSEPFEGVTSAGIAVLNGPAGVRQDVSYAVRQSDRIWLSGGLDYTSGSVTNRT